MQTLGALSLSPEPPLPFQAPEEPAGEREGVGGDLEAVTRLGSHPSPTPSRHRSEPDGKFWSILGWPFHCPLNATVLIAAGN